MEKVKMEKVKTNHFLQTMCIHAWMRCIRKQINLLAQRQELPLEIDALKKEDFFWKHIPLSLIQGDWTRARRSRFFFIT